MLILVIFLIPYILIWKFDLGIIHDSNSSSLTSKYMLSTLFLDIFIIADNLLITLSSLFLTWKEQLPLFEIQKTQMQFVIEMPLLLFKSIEIPEQY